MRSFAVKVWKRGRAANKYSCSRHLALLLDSYDKHCLKLIILSYNCSLWTLVFLAGYRQNAKSLQGHIRFAIYTWVGLHPCTSPTIVAISVLLIYVSDNWSLRQLIITLIILCISFSVCMYVCPSCLGMLIFCIQCALKVWRAHGRAIVVSRPQGTSTRVWWINLHDG